MSKTMPCIVVACGETARNCSLQSLKRSQCCLVEILKLETLALLWLYSRFLERLFIARLPARQLRDRLHCTQFIVECDFFVRAR
jgi:hypothetical protein